MTGPPRRARFHRRMRRACGVALYVLAAVLGVCHARPDPEGFTLIVSLALASAAVGWMTFDARGRGHAFPSGTQFAAFLTWPLAALACLVKARGWVRGVGLWALHAAGLAAAYVFVPAAASVAAAGWGLP